MVHSNKNIILLRRLLTSYTVTVLAFGLLYFLLGEIGLLIQSSQSGLTMVWPASGLAFAVLFLLRMSLWPGIFVGMGLLAWSSGIPWHVAGLAAIGSVMEAIVAVLLF